MRKNIIYALSCSLLALSAFTSCSENDLVAEGEGKVQLKVNIESEVDVITRNVPSEAELADAAVVRIYSESGLIRKYNGLSTLPSEMALKSGEYSVKVVAGDSVPASFDKVYYKGLTPFTVKAAQLTPVAVPCKIANTLTSVVFEGIDEAFSDYEVKLFLESDTLTFTKANANATGYFMLPSTPGVLGWLFDGTQLNGNKYQKKGSLDNVKPTTKYTITFTFTEAENSNGGALIEINVDETEIRVDHDVVIFQAPKISGDNFPIAEPVYFELNQADDLSVWVSTSSKLKSLQLDFDRFALAGISQNSLQLVDMAADLASELESKGVLVNNKYNEAEDKSDFKITFAKSFVEKLTAHEGSYELNITALDSNDKTRTAVLTIAASNATITTLPVEEKDVWSTKAILRGQLVQEVEGVLSFRYRAVGSSNWASVAAVRSGNMLTAQVSDLAPATTYEYQLYAGDIESSVVSSFKTESALQLPNNSFENWYKSGKIWYIHGENEAMFWDCGNTGSATMNKNVTTADETVLHSGAYSVKLQSQFVGIGTLGKFAAGNLFAGEYLKTDGTDGILGFGREFDSRPVKLRGYYKYRTGDITHSSLSDHPKGAPDVAHIYVALGDWELESYEGKDYPVIIKTKTSERKLFDSQDPAIIAYGEIIPSVDTDGDGMHMFEIEIDYRTYERKPTHIVLVASASKYGDYFTGSTSSTMWLDDLELIYE